MSAGRVILIAAAVRNGKRVRACRLNHMPD
jgi:hypothetical protein